MILDSGVLFLGHPVYSRYIIFSTPYRNTQTGQI